MGGRNYTCSMTVLYLLDILWCPLLIGERRRLETTFITSCCCKGYRAGLQGTGMGGRDYTCSMTVLYFLNILWCPLLIGERRGLETTLTTSCCCKGYRAGVQGDGDGGRDYTCSMTVLYLLDILWCPLLIGERRGLETTLTTSCCWNIYTGINIEHFSESIFMLVEGPIKV